MTGKDVIDIPIMKEVRSIILFPSLYCVPRLQQMKYPIIDATVIIKF